MDKSTRSLTDSQNDMLILQQASCKYIAPLGLGAFGRVYQVDPGDGLIHAAKVMKKNDWNPREWQAARELAQNIGQHPNIIRYDGIFNAESYIVILMEYANMPSLSVLIDYSGQPLEEDVVIHLIWQLLQGVAAIHQSKLVHRDLKPENILLHNPGGDEVVLKISDFGLSRQLDDDQLARTHCGTPLHMAPEVLMKNGAFNNKADLWSVGVIIHPFQSKTLDELKKRVKQPPQKPTNLSNQCWELIQHLLCFDAKDRFSAEEALKHQFFAPIYWQ
ncbi:MAG: putative kinase domain protein [Streblomastix strix]|uniref:Putative kinase domain protein n=1 Tax=Streblomastix strix TaxID=222440 RepID=A0A5J4V1W2_9EUKA|nr:MAG: putative kinase domain protein [Streblomastix strix]